MRRPPTRNSTEIWLTLLAISLAALFIGLVQGL